MYCKHCSAEVHEDAVVCVKCGRSLVDYNRSRFKTLERRNEWNDLGKMYTISFIIPIVGVVIGISGLVKGKEKSINIISVSIASWIIWAMIFEAVLF